MKRYIPINPRTLVTRLLASDAPTAPVRVLSSVNPFRASSVTSAVVRTAPVSSINARTSLLQPAPFNFINWLLGRTNGISVQPNQNLASTRTSTEPSNGQNKQKKFYIKISKIYLNSLLPPRRYAESFNTVYAKMLLANGFPSWLFFSNGQLNVGIPRGLSLVPDTYVLQLDDSAIALRASPQCSELIVSGTHVESQVVLWKPTPVELAIARESVEIERDMVVLEEPTALVEPNMLDAKFVEYSEDESNLVAIEEIVDDPRQGRATVELIEEEESHEQSDREEQEQTKQEHQEQTKQEDVKKEQWAGIGMVISPQQVQKKLDVTLQPTPPKGIETRKSELTLQTNKKVELAKTTPQKTVTEPVTSEPVATNPVVTTPDVAAEKEQSHSKSSNAKTMETHLGELTQLMSAITALAQRINMPNRVFTNWCKEQLKRVEKLTDLNEINQLKQQVRQLHKLVDVIVLVTTTLKQSSCWWTFGYNAKGIKKAQNISSAFANSNPIELLSFVNQPIKKTNERDYPGLNNLFSALSSQRSFLFKSKEARSFTLFKQGVEGMKGEDPTDTATLTK